MGRHCPNGHGTLLILDHRYAKLINKKGDSGKDRLRKLQLLQEQWRINNEENSIGNIKRIGTGKTRDAIDKFLHPYRAKIR